jgi:hypothetical protein
MDEVSSAIETGNGSNMERRGRRTAKLGTDGRVTTETKGRGRRKELQ